jgi:tartrate dehydrogenase/decarboxylase/D-malate dehydrogenase
VQLRTEWRSACLAFDEQASEEISDSVGSSALPGAACTAHDIKKGINAGVSILLMGVLDMRDYHIAVIPGDGIGQEVCPEGLKVLAAVAERTAAFRLHFESFPWGCDYYLRHGRMMADDGLKILEQFDAIYFGAVGFPTVADDVSLHGLRLPICQGFEQYANVRPSLLLPGVRGPLRDRTEGDIDFVVVRENTEGEYTGAGGRVHEGLPIEVAVETAVFTRAGVQRLMRFAYELARSRPRQKLASVTKSNAQRHTLMLWDEVFEGMSDQYPDVGTERVLVDAMAARFVLHPETLDVVVASNLFADILTDLGGAICGSLGMVPSGNINPEREYPSMFEPIHGSAPDIAGQGISNPTAMIWSGAMMLEFLGQTEGATLIMKAIRAVTGAGRILTPDLGGQARTTEVGDAIAAQVLDTVP